jgi:hypothetical protein
MFYLKQYGRYVRYIEEGRLQLTKNIGSAMQFPTSDEADSYAIENGRSWLDFELEHIS